MHYDMETWRAAVSIPKTDGRSKNCLFCSKKNPSDNNFCGNCGADIKDVDTDLTPAEVVDICLRMSQPPIPLQVLADVDNVYIGQVLAEGDNVSMVEAYALRLGLPPLQARIFAFIEKKRES
jgi:hypothetical protein